MTPVLGHTGNPVPQTEALPLGPLPGSRYPDPHIEAIDRKRFKGSPGTGAVERVAAGFRWAEGPAYFRAGNYLVFSDIPNNRQMRLLADDNHLSVFRSPSLNANGNTVDRQGRLITCQHAARRVVRTEFDGTVTTIADRYDGKRLNAPNDVVVASDNSIWFTDPTYGIGGDYEGLQSPQEQPTQNVYRLDPRLGRGRQGRRRLHPAQRPRILPRRNASSTSSTAASPMAAPPISASSMSTSPTGRLANGRVFAEDFAPGFTDGLRLDIEGNVWTSMGWADPNEDGVRCYAPNGDLIGKIHLPETCANLCFGGLLATGCICAPAPPSTPCT